MSVVQPWEAHEAVHLAASEIRTSWRDTLRVQKIKSAVKNSSHTQKNELGA